MKINLKDSATSSITYGVENTVARQFETAVRNGQPLLAMEKLLDLLRQQQQDINSLRAAITELQQAPTEATKRTVKKEAE